MSVYNTQPQLLDQSVKSILSQSYEDFEFVIVDDGSDTITKEALARYDDPRIVMIRHGRNLGLARSLNEALQKARGVFIARQDADDVSLPKRIEAQVNFLDNHPKVGLLGTWYEVIDQTGKRLSTVRNPTDDKTLRDELHRKNCFMHGTVMMRRDVLDEVGGYRLLPVAQDYDLWLRLIERCEVANLPESLFEWRLNLTSVSVQKAALQARYALLSQEMALERQKTGEDSFDKNTKDSKLRLILADNVGDNPWGFDVKERAIPYLVLAGSLFNYGAPLQAFWCGMKGLREDPWNRNVWMLLLKRPLRWIAARFVKGNKVKASSTPIVLAIGPWSLQEPTCQRLQLAPLRCLARSGLRVHFLTFERPGFKGSKEDVARWQDELKADGITWHPLPYHHRPLILSKILDGLLALWVGWRLIMSESVVYVHGRSVFPGIIAGILGWITRRPVLYELDASISEERVDVGLWRRGSLVYRVTRLCERWVPMMANEMIVLSKRHADRLKKEGVHIPITVLPSCTDTEIFIRDQANRTEIRNSLNWTDQLVIVYSGSLGGWYRFEEMADFMSRLCASRPRTHWLCLVNDDHNRARRIAEEHGVPPEALTVRSVPVKDVPRWLSACDLAISFIRAGTSKFASSPTKFAEFLSCGIPILSTAGVGDTEALLKDPHAGYVVTDLNANQYSDAIKWIDWVAKRLEISSAVCRRIACEQLSLHPRSENTYLSIYQRLTGAAQNVVRSEAVKQAVPTRSQEVMDHVR